MNLCWRDEGSSRASGGGWLQVVTSVDISGGQDGGKNGCLHGIHQKSFLAAEGAVTDRTETLNK